MTIKNRIKGKVKQEIKREAKYQIRRIITGIVIAVLAAAAGFVWKQVSENTGGLKNQIEVWLDGNRCPDENASLEAVTLDRVVDGDTLWIYDSNYDRIKVRLIGIDTPESVHSDASRNNEYGKMASDYTKEILSGNQTLYLEYDVEATDQYGRTLAYVWLSDDVDRDNVADVSDKMLNAILVKNGYAYDKVYEPNHAYADTFEALRMEASECGIGLWQYEGFQQLWEINEL